MQQRNNNQSFHSPSIKVSRRRSEMLRWCACAAAAGLFAANLANAADISWVGAPATPLNFGMGANWAGGVVPDAPDNGFINNGGIATVSTGFTRTMTNLRFGSDAGTTGGLVMTGGGLTTTTNMVFGVNTTGTGTLNISDGEINVGNGLVGDFTIGDDGGGTATISGGVINTAFGFLGKSTNGHGHVTQSGGVLNVARNFVMAELKPANLAAPQTPSDYTMTGGHISVTREMYIGAHGPVTMNLSGTGSIAVADTIHIAASSAFSDPPGGIGTLNMSAGTVTANNFFVIGDGGAGTLNLSGGMITTGFYNTGQNLGAVGRVNHSGGEAIANFAWVVGEESRSALNLYDLSGGTVTVVGFDSFTPGDTNIGAGAGGKGTLKVRGTGVASIANNMILGGANLAGGTLDVSGGTISLGVNGLGTGKLIAGDLGTGTFIISGGYMSTDLVTIGQNASALGTGTQTGGTLIVRSDFAIGETSTNANTYDISGGTLSIGTGPLGGGIFVGSGGSGTLRVGGTAVVNSVGQLSNASAGAGTVSVTGGSLTVGNMANTGLYAQSGGVASLGVVSGIGQMNVSGGTANVISINQGTLDLSATGKVNAAANLATVNVVNNLSITGTSALDLNDGGLIVDYTDLSPLAAVAADISSGYAGGAWNGAGINSSKAAATPKTGLGYSEAAALGITSFGGVPVDGTAVLVRYTLQGDANLDRAVNINDFSLLAANFNTPGAWNKGDFNYDGTVNISDFALLAGNFNLGITSDLPRGSAVPEPAAMALLLGAAHCISRRRRQ